VAITFDMAAPEPRQRGLEAAASAVRRGDLVVLPTDTVYGVGCDAFSSRGLDRLLAAKGRGRDLPVPVLIGLPQTLDGLGYGLTPAARRLAEAFWPGSLTLVVRHQPTLAWELGAGGSVQIRMPLHPVAIELLRVTGPMAVTSANRAGSPPPTTMASAQEQLGDAVSVYLDGGPSLDLPPSTIVDVTAERPLLLRPGAVGLDALREVCPELDASGAAG
jgi:tRNA threonylcarbamoyl adenosine modification protein (Sua5/YciO/YrdC/YwlC family)